MKFHPAAIRRRREALQMTQREMARRIGVSHVAIHNWETGGRRPRADLLPAIAAALDCTIDELYGRGEAESAS